MLRKESRHEKKFISHRGLAQTFDISKVKWDTNTAEVIYPPEYPYIENTLPSMESISLNSIFVLQKIKNSRFFMIFKLIIEQKEKGIFYCKN